MRFLTALAAMACLATAAAAQTAPGVNSAEPLAREPRVVPRETPKEKTPLDQFDLKTTDTGEKVQQRLQLDISKDKDVFIYGKKTTTYPTSRNPGQDFQPVVPQAAPKDSFTIGIGIGRRF